MPGQYAAHPCATKFCLPIVTSAQMASSNSISLSCPVSHCARIFTTERAKDCLRAHLQRSKEKDHQAMYITKYSDRQGTYGALLPIVPPAKDEDHQDIYITMYSNYQGTSSTWYLCSVCRQPFDIKWKSMRKHSLESRLQVVNARNVKDRSSAESRCPECYKIFKYPLSEHLKRGRCRARSGSLRFTSTSKLPSRK